MRNLLVLIVALLGSCLAAGSVAAAGQIALADWLGEGPRYGSAIDAVIRLAFGLLAYGGFVAVYTAVPVLLGYLINRLRVPSDLPVCIALGGLYGFCGGLFLDAFVRPRDEFLGAAIWGLAGIAGGAAFSVIVRRIERSFRPGAAP